MTKKEKALKVFSEGFSCSQAVLGAFAEEYGMEMDDALKISGSFGGGMGGMGLTCGVVTGAYMVIGLKYGRTKAEDIKIKEKNYEAIRMFSDKFAESYGSMICKELLKEDMSTPEGAKIIKEKGLTKIQCPGYVAKAVEILEDMI